MDKRDRGRNFFYYALGIVSAIFGYKFMQDVGKEGGKIKEQKCFSDGIVFPGKKKTLQFLSAQTAQAAKGCQNFISSSKTGGKKFFKKIFSRN